MATWLTTSLVCAGTIFHPAIALGTKESAAPVSSAPTSAMPTVGAEPKAAARCFPTDPQPGAGVEDPFRSPAPRATELNAEGKVLYRQGRWDEARAKYRAAEDVDPTFLAPALNVACSYVRQERFSEAMTEALRLLERGYVPWASEILSAADLGALKVRPEMEQLRRAMDESRRRWSEGLTNDLLFVARMRAPLKIAGDATGVNVLGPRQEVFAWSPRTLRYRQITTEDGRVVGLARSPDRRKIAYFTAEKLVLSGDGAPALRGLIITELDLATLTRTDRAPIGHDVTRLEVLARGGAFFYRVLPAKQTPLDFVLAEGKVEPRPFPQLPPHSNMVAVLTGRGAVPVARSPLPGGCRGWSRDVVAPRSSSRSIEVMPFGERRRFVIGQPHGAGHTGLAIP